MGKAGAGHWGWAIMQASLRLSLLYQKKRKIQLGLGRIGIAQENKKMRKNFCVSLISLCILAVVAVQLTGCANHSRPVVEPAEMTQSQKNFESVWQLSRGALKKYRFELDREDRRAGVITTLPMTGQQLFEFWRKDAAATEDLAESTVQTIYRKAKVSITRGESDSFVADVEVLTYRSNRKAPQVTSASEAYQLFVLPGTDRARRKFLLRSEGQADTEELQEAEDVIPVWMVPLGRDKNLEAKLEAEIAWGVSERLVDVK